MLRSASLSKQRSLLKQKAFFAFWVLFSAWLFYFWPILYPIFQNEHPLWLNLSTYGIIFISLFLIYIKRSNFSILTFTSSQLGLLTLFILASFFVFAHVMKSQYAELSAVILMIPTLVLTTFGPEITRKFLFPLLYLMLIIPLHDNSLPYRAAIVGIAIFILFSYVLYLKFYKTINLEKGILLGFSPNARWLFPTAIAFSILMIAPWLGENIRSFYPTYRKIVLRAPLGIGEWMGPYSITGKTWTPLYSNASAVLQAQYFLNTMHGEETIYLYSAYFDSHRSFDELFDAKNALFDPTVWHESKMTKAQFVFGERKNTVFELELKAGSVSRLVWYWYYIAGMTTADREVAELLDKVRLIAKYAQGSGIIILSTIYEDSPEEARNRLQSFLKIMYPALDVLKQPEIIYTQSNQGGT